MYRIIKVIGNNCVLVYGEENGRELILMGKGVGFGRRPGERVREWKQPDLKEYAMIARETSALQQVNSIEPVFIEAVAGSIDQAEKMLGKLDHGILLPMADHIALAVRRARENREFPNPFHQDIKALFEKEYLAAKEGAGLLERMTKIRLSEDEIGYITLHIHSGMSDENVADAMNLARLVQDAVHMIEEGMEKMLEKESLGYNRLLSHIRYMLARTRKGERVNLDMDDYARSHFPKTYAIAEQICGFLEQELNQPIAREEVGFLAIHIQRVGQSE